MAYPQQYTREQRERAYNLFWTDRPREKRARGKYTLEQISAMTGVSPAMVHKIGRCLG